jgi:putative chitinase
MIDRKFFFDSVRESLFNGVLSQRQVDGMECVLTCWEQHFADSDTRWLAYAMATAHHESAFVWDAIEEYGKGSGKPYGVPAGPYDETYYGRGLVQITWWENYQKAEKNLAERYQMEIPFEQYPHRALEIEPAALVLLDGLVWGWFTGAKVGDFFNDTKNDAYNARKCVNGLDRADTIAGYHHSFLSALKPVEEA